VSQTRLKKKEKSTTQVINSTRSNMLVIF
jgi:hypothetical protein